jgi:hypothetical protein
MLKITERLSRLRIGTPQLLHTPVKQPDPIMQPEIGL